MVIDTHIFLWYCLDDPKLSPLLRERLRAEPHEIWVPSICLWEAIVLAQTGRINVSNPDPARTLLTVFRRTRFNEAPLSAEIATLSRSLPFEHDDPADQFIAATAVALSLPLATSDERLRSLPFLKLSPS